MTYFNQILHTNTFFIIETGMLNGGSALPFFGVGGGWGNPSHRFVYLCLDNVKMYKAAKTS